MSKINIREYSKLKRVVNSYIKDHPIPTREDNDVSLRELVRLKTLTDSESILLRKKTRDRLILCNGGFGMKYVLKYYNLLNDDQAIGELFQEAMIGIAEAIDAFDLSLRTSFTTYAFFHIRKRMIDFIKKNKLVRAPRDIAKNMKNVSEVVDRITSTDRRRPDAVEIQKELHKKFGVILDKTMVESIVLLLDLNSQACEDTFIVEYNDQTSNPPETSIISLMKSNIEQELKDLPELERQRIRFRFGLNGSPHSVEEIIVMLGEEENE